MELCDPSVIAAAYMHISDRALCMLHPDWVNSPLDKKVLTSPSNRAPNRTIFRPSDRPVNDVYLLSPFPPTGMQTGATALMLAAKYGRLRVIKYLMSVPFIQLKYEDKVTLQRCMH